MVKMRCNMSGKILTVQSYNNRKVKSQLFVTGQIDSVIEKSTISLRRQGLGIRAALAEVSHTTENGL